MSSEETGADSRYLEAFEYFKEHSADNDLKSLVAFALFVDALSKWVEQNAPDGEGLDAYFGLALAPQFSNQFLRDADEVLLKVANDLMAREQPRIIAAAIGQCERRFRPVGVWEGFLAALGYTIFLILASILVAWAAPEVIEYARKAYHLLATRPAG